MAIFTRIPAIVLAAGASHRLGHPKQLVTLAGETLLNRTIRIAQESGASPIFVVLGARHEQIEAAIDPALIAHPSGLHVLHNFAWQQGISTSVIAGIEALSPQAAGALFLVCDQPALSASHLTALMSAFQTAGNSSIVASAYAGGFGIPVIFPRSQFAAMLQLTGDRGAKSLLKNSGCPIISLAFEEGSLDIDTEQDLQLFKQAHV